MFLQFLFVTLVLHFSCERAQLVTAWCDVSFLSFRVVVFLFLLQRSYQKWSTVDLCVQYGLYKLILWLLYKKNCYYFIVNEPIIFPYLEQLKTSMVGPSQFLPPHRGAGLSQDLERHKQELTPSTPSSLLQGCHGVQGPKPPLTVWFRSWKTNIKIWSEVSSLKKVYERSAYLALLATVHAAWYHSYRTNSDVLLPLAHVGTVLQCGASTLPEVPATVGVSRLQAQTVGKRRVKRRTVLSAKLVAITNSNSIINNPKIIKVKRQAKTFSKSFTWMAVMSQHSHPPPLFFRETN